MSEGRTLKVLIAGGGVAALEATLALRELAARLVEVEILAPEREFTYRPLSLAAPFRVGETTHFPLHTLVEDAGATLRTGSLAEIDADRHVAVTSDGDELSYDVCLLALGAVARPGLPGALTFAGPGDEAVLSDVLDDALAGSIERIVFAVPSSRGWPLPAYELALLTAAHLSDAGASRARVALVTPEDAPLALFGGEASAAIADVLSLREVEVHVGTVPVEFADGSLRVIPGDPIPADRVIAMPRLEGPRIAGVPADADGFVVTDLHGAVSGLDDVYAAGDLTSFPVKQGGLAAQQADAAAEAIAAMAGAELRPEPFTPVLRGLLLTGLVPRFLRTDERQHQSLVDTEPLWWPPTKIVGRYLSPYLARAVGQTIEPPEGGDAIAVDVRIDSTHTTV